MHDPQKAQQEIISDFSLFDNWLDRYQYLIDLGRRLPDFPEELRTEENRIRERISANLHDELGANLHAIGLLGDLTSVPCIR